MDSLDHADSLHHPTKPHPSLPPHSPNYTFRLFAHLFLFGLISPGGTLMKPYVVSCKSTAGQVGLHSDKYGSNAYPGPEARHRSPPSGLRRRRASDRRMMPSEEAGERGRLTAVAHMPKTPGPFDINTHTVATDRVRLTCSDATAVVTAHVVDTIGEEVLEPCQLLSICASCPLRSSRAR